MLKKNRAAPDASVIPVLYYPDVRAAVDWLTTALPFTERLRIGDHRCQLLHDKGAIIVAQTGGHVDAASSTLQSPGAHSVMLRITGIDQLFQRAKAGGAHVVAEPADHMYGEPMLVRGSMGPAMDAIGNDLRFRSVGLGW